MSSVRALEETERLPDSAPAASSLRDSQAMSLDVVDESKVEKADLERQSSGSATLNASPPPLDLERQSSGSATLNASPPPLDKSYGVQKSEAAARWMTPRYVYAIFLLITLAAYVVSLDQYTASTYETQALSTTFGVHSLISTINTVEGIMQAVSQPPFAKLCDLLGRSESYLISVTLYFVGYILVSSSPNIGTYAGGIVIYTLGITGFWLINQIIIADHSSTRTRLFWSIAPSIPGTINVWVSGNIASDIIANSSWRWGFAIYTILVPAILAPVILALAWAERRARQLGYLDSVVAPWKHGKAKIVARDVWWQTDLLGLVLLTAGFGLLLIPMTIARTAADGWQSALVPGMMVPGGLLLIVFFFYEAKGARYPIFPIYLLRTRTVVAGFMMNFFNPCASSVQGNYLFTWYRVSANQTILSATRLNNLAVFTSTLTAAATGLLVIKVRHIKPFIVAGACIQVLALGLMTRFRSRDQSVAELAVLQVLKGLGAGMINFPIQAAVQTACKHEHIALVTAALLALFYIGRAVGSAIGGAVWSAQLPNRLLQAAGGNSTLAQSIYGNPIGFIDRTPYPDPTREAVAVAYSEAQRYILITAVSIACIPVLLAACLGNPRLGDSVTLEQVEGEEAKPAAGDKMEENEQKGLVRSTFLSRFLPGSK